ncbi:MAG: hypothetical protein CML24_14580 [Rhizobiales bacterium]|nr:hypothetical protein [Hyphomicrobiales bacterium]|tara:strand:+ start:9992 stop:10555 length:564 start_codon:yes stop_codon:yes gene_type:complete
MSDDSNDVSSLFEGASEFEGDPPLPPEQDEEFYSSEMVIGWLNSVASGHDRYYCLSHVFSSVVLHSRSAGRKGNSDYLNQYQRDRVLKALRAARYANPSMFWEDTAVARQITRHGFDTLEKLVELWTFDLFAQQPSDDERLDIYDYARIFQNLMHNISLAEEIEERTRERAAKDVAKIRSMALGATV